jgi:hypothetical protein
VKLSYIALNSFEPIIHNCRDLTREALLVAKLSEVRRVAQDAASVPVVIPLFF